MKVSGFLLVVFALAGVACRQAEEAGEEQESKNEREQILSLSPEALRAAGIQVVTVSREAFHPHVLASGVIKPDARKSVTVRAPLAGRVVEVLADVGDRVKKDQPLARMESPELTSALARHRTASAREAAAERAFERAERLVELKAVSRS